MKKNINNLFVIVLLLFLCNSLMAQQSLQPKNDTVPKTFAELKQWEHEVERKLLDTYLDDDETILKAYNEEVCKTLAYVEQSESPLPTGWLKKMEDEYQFKGSWTNPYTGDIETTEPAHYPLSSWELFNYTYCCDKERWIIKEIVSYVVVEEKPLFMGGDISKFSEWLASQLVYPQSAIDSSIQGRVYVQFVIEADGFVTDIKVLRGIYPELDQEAVRGISMSPRWTPGKQSRRIVRVACLIPVTFQL